MPWFTITLSVYALPGSISSADIPSVLGGYQDKGHGRASSLLLLRDVHVTRVPELKAEERHVQQGPMPPSRHANADPPVFLLQSLPQILELCHDILELLPQSCCHCSPRSL